MNFDYCVDVILDLEKGYVNHPRDPGGETKFGITKRFYPELDIKKLTKAEAKEIYYKDYWDKLNLHLMPPGLNLLIFDCAVNQGQPTSIKFLQDCLSTPRTGAISMEDLDALENLGAKKVMALYIQKRKVKYQVTKNFDVFGTGWMTRLLEVTTLAFVEK